jgi:hypothetical protein
MVRKAHYIRGLLNSEDAAKHAVGRIQYLPSDEADHPATRDKWNAGWLISRNFTVHATQFVNLITMWSSNDRTATVKMKQIHRRRNSILGESEETCRLTISSKALARCACLTTLLLVPCLFRKY